MSALRWSLCFNLNSERMLSSTYRFQCQALSGVERSFNALLILLGTAAQAMTERYKGIVFQPIINRCPSLQRRMYLFQQELIIHQELNVCISGGVDDVNETESCNTLLKTGLKEYAGSLS